MYNEWEQNKDLLTWIKDYDIDSISKNKIELNEDKKAILDHVYKNSKNIRKFFFNNYLTGISNNLNVRSDKNSYQYMNFFGKINNKNKTTISIDDQSEDKSKVKNGNSYSNSKLFINKTYEEYKENKTINLERENNLNSCKVKTFENNNSNINFMNNYIERINDGNQKIDDWKNSNAQNICQDNNINYNKIYQDNIKNNKFKKRNNFKCGLRYNNKFIKNNELSQEEDIENKKITSINSNKEKKIIIKEKSNKNNNKSYYFKFYNGNGNKDIEKYESKIKILLKKHKSHKATNKISQMKSQDNTMKNMNKTINNESNRKIKISQNNKNKNNYYHDGESKKKIEYKEDKEIGENIQKNIVKKYIYDKKLNIDIKDIINPINNNDNLYSQAYVKKRKIYILKNPTEKYDSLNIDESNKGKNIDDIIKSIKINDENSNKISQENEHINEEKDSNDYICNKKENIFNEEINKNNNINDTINDKKELNLNIKSKYGY